MAPNSVICDVTKIDKSIIHQKKIILSERGAFVRDEEGHRWIPRPHPRMYSREELAKSKLWTTTDRQELIFELWPTVSCNLLINDLIRSHATSGATSVSCRQAITASPINRIHDLLGIISRKISSPNSAFSNDTLTKYMARGIKRYKIRKLSSSLPENQTRQSFRFPITRARYQWADIYTYEQEIIREKQEIIVNWESLTRIRAPFSFFFRFITASIKYPRQSAHYFRELMENHWKKEVYDGGNGPTLSAKPCSFLLYSGSNHDLICVRCQLITSR